MNPRSGDIVEKYTGYLDDMSVPGRVPAKVFMTAGLRGHMHLRNLRSYGCRGVADGLWRVTMDMHGLSHTM